MSSPWNTAGSNIGYEDDGNDPIDNALPAWGDSYIGGGSAAYVPYFLIFASGSCYFAAWWEEIIYGLPADGSIPDGGYAVISTTQRTVTQTYGGSGLWVPASFTADVSTPDAINTWPHSETFTPAWPETDDTYNSYLVDWTNFRFSCLASYTPPTDGSANGYPAPGSSG